MFHKEDKVGYLDGEVQRLDSQFRLGWWQRVTKGETHSEKQAASQISGWEDQKIQRSL